MSFKNPGEPFLNKTVQAVLKNEAGRSKILAFKLIRIAQTLFLPRLLYITFIFKLYPFSISTAKYKGMSCDSRLLYTIVENATSPNMEKS